MALPHRLRVDESSNISSGSGLVAKFQHLVQEFEKPGVIRALVGGDRLRGIQAGIFRITAKSPVLAASITDPMYSSTVSAESGTGSR